MKINLKKYAEKINESEEEETFTQNAERLIEHTPKDIMHEKLVEFLAGAIEYCQPKEIFGDDAGKTAKYLIWNFLTALKP